MWCVSVFGILAATCTSLARGVLQKTPVGEFRDPGDQVGCVLPGRAAEVCGEVVAAIDRARSIAVIERGLPERRDPLSRQPRARRSPGWSRRDVLVAGPLPQNAAAELGVGGASLSSRKSERLLLESQLACQAQRFKRSESGLVLTGHVINRVACCAWRCVACWHRSWLPGLLLPHT